MKFLFVFLVFLSLNFLSAHNQSQGNTLIRYFQPKVKVIATPSERFPGLVSFEVQGTVEDEGIKVNKLVREVLVQSKTRSSWSGWRVSQVDSGIYPAHCTEDDDLLDCPRLGEVDGQGNLLLSKDFEANAQYMEIVHGPFEVLKDLLFRISMPTASYVSLYFNRIP